MSLKYFTAVLKIEKMAHLRVPFYLQGALSKIFGFRAPRNRAFYFQLNKLFSHFGLLIKIFPRRTPFNMERSIHDIEQQLLPVKIGILKHEMFGCLEDDNSSQGSCLIKRGLYPLKLQARLPESASLRNYHIHKRCLESGQTINLQYSPLSQRVCPTPLRSITVIQGQIEVCGRDTCYIVDSGNKFLSYSNIPTAITAKAKSIIETNLILP